MQEHNFEIRVSYAETDQMGVVYYGNYLTWFERGRTELFRAAGIPYKEMEKQDLYLPVVEANCVYKAPAFYDDIIIIATKVDKLGRSSMSFSYDVVRKETGQVIANGVTRHCFINAQRKVVPIPEEIKKTLNGE